MTITEFLLARIADDEANARAAIADDGDSDEGFAGQYAKLIQPPSGVGLAQGGFGEAAARMIATYAVPRRVLAECEAKRRIVDTSERMMLDADDAENQMSAKERMFAATCAHANLRALASVYADHPDFAPEWRV